MFAVIDTNILVSSLWSRGGAPAQVMALVLSASISPCYDFRIMEEYRDVLSRPKFGFKPWMVSDLLNRIEDVGVNVIATVSYDGDFVDEDDRKFWEVAKHCNAKLITGNMKHFPPGDSDIMTATTFLEKYRSGLF